MQIVKFSNSKKSVYNLHSFFFWAVAAMFSIPPVGGAKTVFYGVGNDRSFNDVVGIETALSRSTGAGELISYSYANLSGNDIYETTVALRPFFTGDDTLVWYYSGHGGYFSDDAVGDETRSGSTALDSYDEVIGLQGDSDQTETAFSWPVNGFNIPMIVDALNFFKYFDSAVLFPLTYIWATKKVIGADAVHHKFVLTGFVFDSII